MNAGEATVGARRVICPRCKGPALYAASNPWRPFCSERCSSIDLGAWASEAYRVRATEPTDGPAADDPA
jgi:endogenous inhibitor of DNA gyrase (YacG/DUF329 family)